MIELELIAKAQLLFLFQLIFIYHFKNQQIYIYILGNPHSPFSLGPETPPPAYSPHDDGSGGERPPDGLNMETDNSPHAEPVPYQVEIKPKHLGINTINISSI